MVGASSHPLSIKCRTLRHRSRRHCRGRSSTNVAPIVAAKLDTITEQMNSLPTAVSTALSSRQKDLRQLIAQDVKAALVKEIKHPDSIASLVNNICGQSLFDNLLHNSSIWKGGGVIVVPVNIFSDLKNAVDNIASQITTTHQDTFASLKVRTDNMARDPIKKQLTQDVVFLNQQWFGPGGPLGKVYGKYESSMDGSLVQAIRILEFVQFLEAAFRRIQHLVEGVEMYVEVLGYFTNLSQQFSEPQLHDQSYLEQIAPLEDLLREAGAVSDAIKPIAAVVRSLKVVRQHHIPENLPGGVAKVLSRLIDHHNTLLVADEKIADIEARVMKSLTERLNEAPTLDAIPSTAVEYGLFRNLKPEHIAARVRDFWDENTAMSHTIWGLPDVVEGLQQLVSLGYVRQPAYENVEGSLECAINAIRKSLAEPLLHLYGTTSFNFNGIEKCEAVLQMINDTAKAVSNSVGHAAAQKFKAKCKFTAACITGVPIPHADHILRHKRHSVLRAAVLYRRCSHAPSLSRVCDATERKEVFWPRHLCCESRFQWNPCYATSPCSGICVHCQRGRLFYRRDRSR